MHLVHSLGRGDHWDFGIDGFDLTNGGDENELEDQEGKEAGGDNGQKEFLEAGHDSRASAWLFEGLLLGDWHVAVVLNSRHFLFDFFLLINNSKDSLLKDLEQKVAKAKIFSKQLIIRC